MARRQPQKHTARDVKMYSTPQLIHNYNRETGRGPLHITDKHCEHGGHRKDMTRCGRIMYPHHRGFRRNETLENFQLCKRCGTKDEFTQAIAEGAEWQKQWNEKEQLRREQEEAARLATHQERCERMVELVNVLDLKCGHDPGSEFITFEFRGHKFTVTEATE